MAVKKENNLSSLAKKKSVMNSLERTKRSDHCNGYSISEKEDMAVKEENGLSSLGETKKDMEKTERSGNYTGFSTAEKETGLIYLGEMKNDMDSIEKTSRSGHYTHFSTTVKESGLSSLGETKNVMDYFEKKTELSGSSTKREVMVVKKENDHMMMGVLTAVGSIAAALVGWGIYQLCSSHSNPETSKKKKMMMKIPGKNGYIPREDFERDPRSKFREWHKK